MTAILVPRGRLRPVSVGGARLARPMAWALVGLLALVTLVAVFARQLAPYNPIQPVGPINLPPLSPGHLLGTDGIGRDLLSRTLIGIQVSWLSALVVVASGLLIGGTIGLIAGATGGWVDSILLMRLTDLFLALPGALVAIAIVAALGSGLVNTLIGVALVFLPLVRGRGIGGDDDQSLGDPRLLACRMVAPEGAEASGEVRQVPDLRAQDRGGEVLADHVARRSHRLVAVERALERHALAPAGLPPGLQAQQEGEPRVHAPEAHDEGLEQRKANEAQLQRVQAQRGGRGDPCNVRCYRLRQHARILLHVCSLLLTGALAIERNKC